MKKNASRIAFATGCLLVAGLFLAPRAQAQGDPSIMDWGTPPGNPPPWQTADIWVDNNGLVHNEPGEPSKGITNRLFAHVKNLAGTPANGVTVRFKYAPYGLWSPASWADFKEIAAPFGINLGAAGSGTDDVTVEVDWDLSNLAEDNGGNWGGHTLGEFDHFCVLVQIEYPGDANPSNNHAQNNFANIPTTFGARKAIKFVLPNPERSPMEGGLRIAGIPKEWKYQIEGIESPERFVLKAREIRPVTLTVEVPQAANGSRPYSHRVDVSLLSRGRVAGGISFDLGVTPALPPSSSGQLTPYVTGTWDLREDRKSVVQLVNPTGGHLKVQVAFFDDNERPLGCVRGALSPNDLLEVEVAAQRLPARFGVVKAVSFDESGRPAAGIVGYQRLFSRIGLSEAPLHPIPAAVLEGDLPFIRRACR